MQCFQKDCNLRVSAKKLSKHPWIQMSRKKATGSQRSREKAVPAYEEAVESVRQWNEALKGSSNRNSGRMRRMTNDKGKLTAFCIIVIDRFPSSRAGLHQQILFVHAGLIFPLPLFFSIVLLTCLRTNVIDCSSTFYQFLLSRAVMGAWSSSNHGHLSCTQTPGQGHLFSISSRSRSSSSCQ